MALIVAGISHVTAPIDVREKLTLRPQEALRELAGLRELGFLREGVVLSTCNRTEVYAVENGRDLLPEITTVLSNRLGSDASEFVYVRRDREAAAHLFAVTAGLRSMILGEAQIQGQVKDAWEQCRSESGPVLNRMFQTALLAASRAREETGIGRGAASVSSAAVQLAKKIFGNLTGRSAMVLGAGDVAELALECLQSEGVRVAIVANRTHERAQALAERHGAVAMHYDQCWESLRDVDVLICSTASPVPVVTVARVRSSIEARGDRPLCILDIALPRDVEAAVGELGNVFLYDLDDLRAAAAANLEQRAEDIPAAQAIVAAESAKFWDWVAGLAAVPVVREFREEMDKLRSTELAAALRRLGALTPEQTDAIEHFSKSLMNKFLHEPSVRLKAAAANGRGLGVVDAARYLFALEKGAAGDQHLAADQRAAAADQHAPITEHPTSGEPTEIA
ncbi:MAG TPA: glutamyl-tRNA reductase [Gemmatimonadaceae bacterium]|nr:glutamyl-tRNA reductase [Gemmatimonadaceae bacterium]